MTITTILLLIASLLVAAGLSYYQYFYRIGTRSKVNWYLALLRFLAVFGVLLLLINPVISRKLYEIEKTPFVIAIDNSASIIDLKASESSLKVYEELISNKALQEKFEIQSFKFDSEFETADKFDFKGKQTNIDLVSRNISSINKNKIFPTVIITDGNQTSGNDYVYGFNPVNKVYPVIVGDTTTFTDLKISRLNVNKYAFHKNKFPVEIFLQYSGTKAITANFSISQGSTTYNKQSVSFSSTKKTAVINLLLPAEKVGLQIFKATISSSEKEKNTYNNSKNFAVEVIDQRTEVAIISSINHPDIGALKRSIESNSQRKVTILKPNAVNDLANFNVLILYQPTADFKSVFDSNKSVAVNTFIITGKSTNYQFLNLQQSNLVFKMSSQSEDYIAAYNEQFNLFSTDNIGFEAFPPLQNAFGTVTTSGNVNTLLSSKIRNIATNSPMLAFAENQGKRSAFLIGEDIWKWRLQSHVETKSFEKFDIFIDKIIQYLASDNSRKSLVVTHESFYNSGEAIEINAQFFNKNYEFDEKARLTIAVTNRNNKRTKNYDLLKGTNSFKVNLDGLEAGQYNFTVRELNSKTSYNGYFEILDFDIEKQFVNPDVIKLNQLAMQTDGKTFMPDQTELLIKTLLENDSYKAVQKEITRKIPLIDWMWLLIIIAVLLSSEWFLRKYNGML